MHSSFPYTTIVTLFISVPRESMTETYIVGQNLSIVRCHYPGVPVIVPQKQAPLYCVQNESNFWQISNIYDDKEIIQNASDITLGRRWTAQPWTSLEGKLDIIFKNGQKLRCTSSMPSFVSKRLNPVDVCAWINFDDYPTLYRNQWRFIGTTLFMLLSLVFTWFVCKDKPSQDERKRWLEFIATWYLLVCLFFVNIILIFHVKYDVTYRMDLAMMFRKPPGVLYLLYHSGWALAAFIYFSISVFLDSFSYMMYYISKRRGNRILHEVDTTATTYAAEQLHVANIEDPSLPYTTVAHKHNVKGVTYCEIRKLQYLIKFSSRLIYITKVFLECIFKGPSILLLVLTFKALRRQGASAGQLQSYQCAIDATKIAAVTECIRWKLPLRIICLGTTAFVFHFSSDMAISSKGEHYLKSPAIPTATMLVVILFLMTVYATKIRRYHRRSR